MHVQYHMLLHLHSGGLSVHFKEEWEYIQLATKSTANPSCGNFFSTHKSPGLGSESALSTHPFRPVIHRNRLVLVQWDRGVWQKPRSTNLLRVRLGLRARGRWLRTWVLGWVVVASPLTIIFIILLPVLPTPTHPPPVLRSFRAAESERVIFTGPTREETPPPSIRRLRERRQGLVQIGIARELILHVRRERRS